MTHVYKALLAIGLLLPASTLALTLQADDTVAGLGTTISMAEAGGNKVYSIVITPPLGAELITDVTTNTSGEAEISLPSSETEVAGTYSVYIEDKGKTITATSFQVLADKTHSTSSTLTNDTTYVIANGKDTTTVSVILRDRYGNPLANRPVKLISSRTQDVIQNVSVQTDATGEQKFTVSTLQPGTISLRAMDFISGEIIANELMIDAGSTSTTPAMGGNDNYTNRALYGPRTSGTSNFGAGLRAQVSYGPVASFVITAPRNLQVNDDATIRITAVDADGNRVEDYTGTVYLSSTDPNAFLPINGEIPFRDQDFGEKQLTLGLRFRTAGEHELHAEDANNPTIRGYTLITVSGGNPTGQTKLIKINQPKDNAVVNNASITITGTTEPFVNLIVTGGLEDRRGETDINGNFTITNVELDEEQTEHTLRVTDDSNLLDSGDIHITLDTTPPEIISVSISPENPTEGTDALIVVVTDETVAAFAAKLDGETLDMNTSPGKPNTYQALIEAPQAGAHELKITVADAAQNEITDTSVFRTSLKGLPKVTGLQVTTEGDIINLAWDAITIEEVDAYRIYVGQTPTDFAFSLDSNQATTSAQIAGLQPGIEYYFAVTALKGERESEQKSDVARGSVYGISLEPNPQNNAIQIDWSSMQTNIPLSSFILEYGVQPDVYTEKRILNGDLRNYTIRDLINDVQYYIKLTPVSLTGELVEAMVATTEAIPVKVGEGFAITAADTIPSDFNVAANINPPPNLHQAAPSTSSTGLPNYMWWLAGMVAVGLWTLRWRRKQQLQSAITFMQAMDERYRNQ